GVSRVRSICFLDHRVRRTARPDGRGPVSIEGAASRTLRLPVTGLDGCDRHPRRQGVREACGLIAALKSTGLTAHPDCRTLAAAPAPAASGAFFEGQRHHLPHSVRCLSSIENTAPSFTSTFLTMQTRPMLSASFTSYRPGSMPVILKRSSWSTVSSRSFLHWS